MATTIRNSTLKVQISESIILDGGEQGVVTTKKITGVNEIYKRIIACPTAAETILYNTHATTVSGNTLTTGDVKYLRITNKDDTNYVDLIIENSAGDETGLKLKAGTSVMLWEHSSMLEAAATDVTVTVETAATAVQTVTDGDAATGMTEGQYVQLISSSGQTVNYVLSDTSDGGVATGTVLASSTDIGSNTFGALVSAVTTGIAVGVNLNLHKQNNYLEELKVAIESSNGHNGTITVGAVPGEADGNQSITLTQAVSGTAGNTTTTEDVANFTSADFTGGLEGEVTNKVDILSVNAIANTDTVNLEIFAGLV